MDAQFEKGPRFVADGTEETPMLGDGCTVVTNDGVGKFAEFTKRGYIYSQSTAAVGVAMAATNASPLAAGTGTPVIALYNPVGNQEVFHVLRVKACLASGTPTGPFTWNVMPAGNVITQATFSQGINHRSKAAGGNGRVFLQIALTGGSAFVNLRAIGGPAAIAAGAGVYSVEEYCEGDMVVYPGECVAIAEGGVGTGVAVGSITWMVLPLLS